MLSYLIERFNFRNGAFLLTTLILSCAFVTTVLLFAYNFTQVSDESFTASFWNNTQLSSQKNIFTQHPWTALSYSFFDKKLLSIFANIFWILMLGFRIDTKLQPYTSLTTFVIATVIAGVVFVSAGMIVEESDVLFGARVPLLSFATYIIFYGVKTSVHLDKIQIPILYLALFYLLLSIADIIVVAELSLALSYVASAVIGGFLGYRNKNIFTNNN